MINLEAAMQALFQIGQSIAKNPNGTPSSTPFTISSRRMRHFNDVDPSEMPAFFQAQYPGVTMEKGERGIVRLKFKAYWFVYLPQSQDVNQVVSPVMNQYLIALLTALVPNPRIGSLQTLGGLVYDCYPDGQGSVDEGLLATPSLIIIPITILTGI